MRIMQKIIIHQALRVFALLVMGTSASTGGITLVPEVVNVLHLSQADTEFKNSETTVLPDGRLVVLWPDDRRRGFWDIDKDLFLAVSGNAGTSWGPDLPMSYTHQFDWIIGNTDGYMDIEAIGPSSLLASFSTNNNVHLLRSDDAGETFTLIDQVAIPAEGFNTLAFDASLGRSYWFFNQDAGGEDFDVFGARSDDGFRQDLAVFRVSDGTGSAGGVTLSDTLFDEPNLEADARNGHLWIVWEDQGGPQTRVAANYSPDGGATFTGPFVLPAPPDPAWEYHDPSVMVAADGQAFFAYGVEGDDVYTLHTTSLAPLSFSQPQLNRAFGVDSAQSAEEWAGTLTEADNPVWAVSYGGSGSDLIYIYSSTNRGESFVATRLIEDFNIEDVQIEQIREQGTQFLSIIHSAEETPAQDEISQNKALYARLAVIDETPPPAPSAPTVSAEPGAVKVTWAAVSDFSGIQAYQVEAGESPGGPFTVLGSTEADRLEFVDAERTDSRFYRVRAIDGAGNAGAASAAVEGTPSPPGSIPVSGSLFFSRGSAGDGQIFRSDLSGGAETMLGSGVRPQLFAGGQRLAYWRFVNGVTLSSRALDGTDPVDHDSYANVPGFGLDVAGDPFPVTYVYATSNYCPVPFPGTTYATSPLDWDDGTGEGEGGSSLGLIAFGGAASPDGIRFAALAVGWLGCGSTDYGEGALLLYDRLTEDLVEVGLGLSGVEGFVVNVDFAPDGRALVFTQRLNDVENLLFADFDPATLQISNVRPLTQSAPGEPVRDPAFSLDGEWILFTRGEPEQIYLANRDGTRTQSLGIAGRHPAAGMLEKVSETDPDQDGDGLADAFEQGIIDAVEGDAYAVLADVTPGTDFNDDGISDGLAYALGLDALGPVSPKRLLHFANEQGLRFELSLPAALPDGVTYEIQASLTLHPPNWQVVARRSPNAADWQIIGADITLNETVEGERLRVQFRPGAVAFPYFLRLQALFDLP